jgi:hypothetical protein
VAPLCAIVLPEIKKIALNSEAAIPIGLTGLIKQTPFPLGLSSVQYGSETAARRRFIVTR